ncbi:hypothetical protein BS47DRAFT_562892 [Hydnum rufescens UP504]|uniref:Uncharacterized protein n=1 Tax=Hydnum rufescens UP504 TaxID=1448309 RepID=A0A9P6AGG0_9AGAM|nr:hypothetical protein BS47DRAFT_562892 [Hydnum rufescens UP504]
MSDSNYLLDIHAGNGGSSENDTILSAGGRGGDVFVSYSNPNNVGNVFHIYGHNIDPSMGDTSPIADTCISCTHNVGTSKGDTPLSPDTHICLRWGPLKLRVTFPSFPEAGRRLVCPRLKIQFVFTFPFLPEVSLLMVTPSLTIEFVIRLFPFVLRIRPYP